MNKITLDTAYLVKRALKCSFCEMIALYLFDYADLII